MVYQELIHTSSNISRSVAKKLTSKYTLLFICPSAPSNVNGLETENSALKMECSIQYMQKARNKQR